MIESFDILSADLENLRHAIFVLAKLLQEIIGWDEESDAYFVEAQDAHLL